MNNMELTLSDVDNTSHDYLESVFSLSNGHFGVKASDPISGAPENGTLINGFFEKSPINYAEGGFGYAKNHQTIVNLPDLRHITIFTFDGHPFSSSRCIGKNLNFNNGLLKERYILYTNQKETIYLVVESMIDEIDSHYFQVNYKFFPGTYNKNITINKTISLSSSNIELENDPRKSRQVRKPICNSKFINSRVQQFIIRTIESKKIVTFYLVNPDENLLNQTVSLRGLKKKIRYKFYIGDIYDDSTVELINENDILIADINRHNNSYWHEIWKNGRASIEGNSRLNLALHFNLFHLNQSAKINGDNSIASKGLSGSGYEGHYFWDTEIYMLPYFIYTNPLVAKQILSYRFNTLKKAKERALELGFMEGALFPWRTINGEEASPFFPAGTAQYHINGDIAYSLGQFYKITGDIEFIKKCGFEIVLETARFWSRLGSWNDVNGSKRFEFLTVTGPDEYTALVNNNYYTNRIAKYNLKLVGYLFNEIHHEFDINIDEIEKFNEIADAIYLPYDRSKNIFAQDDSFLSKPRWPIVRSGKENFPLLLNYHPLTIYRYQVAKQADVLLAEVLFPYDINNEQVSNEYEYYKAVTTHDSSLSLSAFSIIASRIGSYDDAYQDFVESLFLDLEDKHRNTSDGLHMANLGGSWLSVTKGFSGMYLKNNVLFLENNLPDKIRTLSYRIRIGKALIEVKLNNKFIEVESIEGPVITLNINKTEYILKKDENLKILSKNID